MLSFLSVGKGLMVQSSNDSGEWRVNASVIVNTTVKSPTARATIDCIDGIQEPPPMQK